MLITKLLQSNPMAGARISAAGRAFQLDAWQSLPADA
jgi:hypothetical protein